jgi:hypothetical protein
VLRYSIISFIVFPFRNKLPFSHIGLTIVMFACTGSVRGKIMSRWDNECPDGNARGSIHKTILSLACTCGLSSSPPSHHTGGIKTVLTVTVHPTTVLCLRFIIFCSDLTSPYWGSLNNAAAEYRASDRQRSLRPSFNSHKQQPQESCGHGRYRNDWRRYDAAVNLSFFQSTPERFLALCPWVTWRYDTPLISSTVGR